MHVDYQRKIPNVLKLNNEMLIVVDSLGVYKIDSLEKPIIILSFSPTINLERLITRLEPKQVIADASNYKSLVQHWKLICDKKKIPFWYTATNGAYTLK